MNIGRRQNADPRWLLPLLCRRGHITRNEIGAIRIGQQETHFQVPRTISGKFADAVARTASSEGEEESVLIEQSEGGPREEARNNRRGRAPGPNRRSEGGAPPYAPKPHRKGGPGGPGGPKRGPGGDGGPDKRKGAWKKRPKAGSRSE